jgi:predicted MFS family arabinose efflux permease
LLAATDSIDEAGLLAISFLLGTSFAFAGPASFALAANAVPDEDMPSAVSLQSAANNLTRVVGPAIAAPIVATSRFEIAFGAFVVAAIIAAVLTGLMKVAAYEPDPDGSGIFARLRAGLDHARARDPALPALFTVATLSLFGVSHVAILPVFAQDVLGDVDLFAWIVAATGFGAMLGAIATGYRRSAPTLRGAARTMLVYGFVLAGFACTRDVVYALLAQFVIGYAYFAVMTNLQTLIQQLVDESKRGRVMSLFQVSWAGLVPFGSLAMGYLARPLGSPMTLLLSASACIAYGIAMTVYASRLKATQH